MADRMPAEPDPAQAALAKARKLIEIGRYNAAIPFLASALAALPDNHSALCLMALAHLQEKRGEESLLFAEKAIVAEPQHEWGHRLHALALRRFTRHAEALEAARRAVECDPEGLFPLHVYCIAQLDSKRTGFACDTADRLIALHPANMLAWETSGRVSLAIGEDAQAESRFRNGLAVDPLSSSLWNNLGVALQRQGNHEEAIRCYSESARLNPEDPLAKKNAVGAMKGEGARHWSALLILAGLPGLDAMVALRMATAKNISRYASPEMLAYINAQRGASAWDIFRKVLALTPAIPLLFWSFLWLVDSDDFQPSGTASWCLYAGLAVWLIIALLILSDRRRRAVGLSGSLDPLRRFFRH